MPSCSLRVLPLLLSHFDRIKVEGAFLLCSSVIFRVAACPDVIFFLNTGAVSKDVLKTRRLSSRTASVVWIFNRC